MMKIEATPFFKYRDSAEDEEYFSPGNEITFGERLNDLLPEEMQDKNWKSGGDEKAREKAYEKVYKDSLEDIKKELFDFVNSDKYKTMQKPSYFELYAKYPWSKKRLGSTIYIDPDADTIQERPSLYDKVTKEIPDLDITNEGGINWNWYSIPNAEQANKLKSIAQAYYNIGRMNEDPTHFRLHKYDEDYLLDAELSKLAKNAAKRSTEQTIKDAITREY